jgi:hypothetical protein
VPSDVVIRVAAPLRIERRALDRRVAGRLARLKL